MCSLNFFEIISRNEGQGSASTIRVQERGRERGGSSTLLCLQRRESKMPWLFYPPNLSLSSSWFLLLQSLPALIACLPLWEAIVLLPFHCRAQLCASSIPDPQPSLSPLTPSWFCLFHNYPLFLLFKYMPCPAHLWIHVLAPSFIRVLNLILLWDELVSSLTSLPSPDFSGNLSLDYCPSFFFPHSSDIQPFTQPVPVPLLHPHRNLCSLGCANPVPNPSRVQLRLLPRLQPCLPVNDVN